MSKFDDLFTWHRIEIESNYLVWDKEDTRKIDKKNEYLIEFLSGSTQC